MPIIKSGGALTVRCPDCLATEGAEPVHVAVSDVDESVEIICPVHGAVGHPITWKGQVLIPRYSTTDSSWLLCPNCGSDDVSGWANDGESDLADWWGCEECGDDGAYLDPRDWTKTQNGCALGF